ncbi:MAG: protein kinase domain-containing protein, partial [Planctomycetota bacterium]
MSVSLRERLALFIRVCGAVHHGHQKGIIHRDLKPSNILVDSSGEPKVIDFGVARATDSDLAVTTLQTDVGQLIGTLQYMSPEQCAADPHDLDTRSDVYALGVVLYELLCDQLPYDVSRAALHEAARVIREEAPARPSTINRTLRGDLETVALKALEKDRTRRYQSAVELAGDLERYLKDEPIVARRPSVGYQVKLFARRHKAAFAAIAVTASALSLATVVSVVFAVRAGLAESEALEAKGEAERKTNEVTRQRNEIQAQRDELEWRAYLGAISGAALALETYDSRGARRLLAQAPELLRGWEWTYLSAAAAPREVSRPETHGRDVHAVDVSPDGTRLLLGLQGAGRSLQIYDAASRRLERAIDCSAGARCARFSHDGRRIFSSHWVSGTNLVLVWDAFTGEELDRWPVQGSRWLAVSPDGKYLACCAGGFNKPSVIEILDAQSGQQLSELDAFGYLAAVAFSNDGTRLATG